MKKTILNTVILATALVSVSAMAADQEFTTTVNIEKPTTTLTISNAEKTVPYSNTARETELTGSVYATGVANVGTYTITFKEPIGGDVDKTKGLALLNGKTTGAVVTTMAWKNAKESNLVLEAGGAGCSSSKDGVVEFKGNNQSCIMKIAGSDLSTLPEEAQRNATYGVVVAGGAIGSFSQTIHYSVEHS